MQVECMMAGRLQPRQGRSRCAKTNGSEARCQQAKSTLYQPVYYLEEYF
jgi:hypothetical protein